ncbi:hypothetical protein O7542_03035 [Micromonospora sp. WMMC264]|uniref:hypothetical protein n=1 Tax=Micromonospora sp. WMMC264 TaxID=3015158 RepID=UPI00248B7049|nr:hypothetical protein [Micromonospora sp. WMMC264]WBB86135.1 hypothetical protein O7542_03035 [Micromonospora sp. WMMC264]
MRHPAITGDYISSAATRFAEERLYTFLRRLDYVCNPSGANHSAATTWFHAMPDFSPSLNEARIREGLPVGGILGWGTPDTHFMPGILPSNGCGILVAKVRALPRIQELVESVAGLAEKPPLVDSRPVIWDAGRKNHFLNFYRDDEGTYYIVLHCSAPELRDTLQSLTKTSYDTPHGSISLFEDGSAEGFRKFAKQAEEFGNKKREIICMAIASDANIIFNRPHMELISDRCFAIGCYASSLPIADVPIMVAPGQPALLVDCSNVIETPQGPIYAVPHGTGNAMTRPGRISYVERHSTFVVERRETAVYDVASQVFDSFPTLDQVGSHFAKWTDSPDARLRQLQPIIELKLQKGKF